MKRVLTSLALALAGTTAFANDLFVGGDAEAGAQKAAVCTACHGPGGNSVNPEWPSLAGQSSKYIVAQLKNFKTGVRRNALMQPQAANLSEQDMKDLAAYYASQKAKPGVAAEESVATADPLHRGGDAERGLAACSACHGPKGMGNPAAGYPRLSGQQATYTANVLRLFRSMGTGEIEVPAEELKGNLGIMTSIAAKLTDKEIEALASYFQGLQ